MTTPWQTLLVSLRNLRRTPGFAVTSVLALGLGIGLSTTVFTVADAVLLRRLPVQEQNNIVVLWGELPARGFDHYPLGLEDAKQFARLATSLQSTALIAYEGAWPTSIQDGAETSRFRRALVSGGYFDVLKAEPLLGRALRPSDDATGAAPVAVLSHRAWQQRFGGDPQILGRRLRSIDTDVTYSIVGVMPPGLDYPRGTDLWTPILPSVSQKNLEFAAFDVIGRLRTGGTSSMARQELTTFLGRPEASPWQRDMRGVVRPLTDLVVGNVRPALLVFATAAGLLLLITCANVATLLLVRGLDRRREVAIRSALGAERKRIVGQLLVENGVLAMAGGALGILVAAVALQAFLSLAPAGLPRLDEVHLNGTALAAAFGITTLALALFGLAPALTTSRFDLQQGLRLDSRHSQSRQSRRAVESLVMGQMALAVVVLAAAGLIAKSLLKLERVDLSLESANLFIGELAVPSDRYDTPSKQLALLEEVMGHLKAVPGVEAISPVVAVPFSGSGGWDGRAASDGQTVESASANPMLNMEVVASDYFRTLGMPILRGRGFSPQDRESAPGVVILSQSAARHYWSGEDPIGRHLRFGADLERTLTVVGVVPDTRYRDLRDARATVYFPLRQSFFPFAPTTLAIRARGSSAELGPAIHAAVAQAAPGLALASLSPFDDLIDAPLAQPRLNAALLTLFAGAALLLAAIGLYGAMATMVRQRRRELALRHALGATPQALHHMVMRRGVTIVIAGSVVGLLGVVMTTRFLHTLLYEISPTDASILSTVIATLFVVALLATYLPARAAARSDPAVALRADE